VKVATSLFHRLTTKPMAKTGPIILIDDDADECELIGDALKQINISNQLICFKNGKEAFEYLEAAIELPFLILTDVNMPVMSGIELRQKISESEVLKRKSIPFIFLTTTAGAPALAKAYEMNVQGFFEKGHSMNEIKEVLKEIYDYWQRCKHPDN
jgi:response regulator RpfG family c-di-GMP phosphodiesterase